MKIVSILLGVLVFCGASFAEDVEDAKLVPFDGEYQAYFGDAVDLFGDYALVGAMLKDIEGDGHGAAYLYQRGAEDWEFLLRLDPEDREGWAALGSAVAGDGDSLVVGAYSGSANDLRSGVAYVFEKQQDIWVQAAKLFPSDAENSDSFGKAVAIQEETIVVGSNRATYVFEKNGTQWQEVEILKDQHSRDVPGLAVAIDGNTLITNDVVFEKAGEEATWLATATLSPISRLKDRFGESVGISGDTIVVGDWSADHGNYRNGGAAYVFSRDQGGENVWGQIARLVPSGIIDLDQFGYAVDIYEDYIAVGAIRHMTYSGGGFLFYRNQGGSDKWGEVSNFEASDTDSFDRFGSAVSLSGSSMLVGAYNAKYDDVRTGAAYVFDNIEQMLGRFTLYSDDSRYDAGGLAKIRVTHATPGELVYLYASSDGGSGGTYIEHLDVKIDMRNARLAADPVVADSFGVAEFFVKVPEGWSGERIRAQAAQYQSKTNLEHASVD